MADTDIQGMLVRIEATTAQLRQELSRAETSVSQASGQIDNSLKQVDAAFDRVEAHSSVLQRAVSAAFVGVGVAAAGVVAGLVALTTRTLNYAQEMQNLSALSNASVEDFQRLAAGARTVGVDQEKLADIFKDTTDRVGEFLSRGGGEMQDFFKEIAPQVGVTAESFKNLSGPQALQLYYDSLEKAGASQQQITSYMEQMADEATALVPLLKNGGEGFKEIGDQAQAAGAVLSGLDISRMIDVNQSIKGLQTSWEGASRQLVTGLLPAVEDATRVLQDMTDNGAAQAVGTAIAFLVDNFNILLGVMGGKVAASFLGYISNLGKSIQATKQVTGANVAQATSAIEAAIANQQAAQSAVVRAEKEAIAAKGTAVQTQMSIQLAEARMVERAATDRLTAAQASLKGISSSLMTVLGGPAGLAALAVGAGIAFLTLRDNSDSLEKKLGDLTDPLDKLLERFNKLNRATQAVALRELQGKIEDTQSQLTQAAGAIADKFESDLRNVGAAGADGFIAGLAPIPEEAQKAIDLVRTAAKDASSGAAVDWKAVADQLRGMPGVTEGMARAIETGQIKASDLTGSLQNLKSKLSELTDQTDRNTASTHANSNSQTESNSAGQAYLETLDKQLATLKDKTAVEAAERFITDNKIKSESDLAKQIRERAKAVDAQREADKAAKDETRDGTQAQAKLTQQLKEASTAYDQLKKTFDPVGAAADEFKKQVANLDLLLKNNKITQEEYGRGVAWLADQFNTAVQASTGLSQAMKYQADLERQLAIARQQADAAAASVGMGDKEAQRTQARLALEQDNNNKILALRDELATASTEKQRQELEKQIALRREYGDKLVQAQQDGFTKLDAAQAEWSNGATSAWANYRDSAADVAGQTQDLFSNMFSGAEDALTHFVKTGKLSFKDFADSVVEDLIRIQVRKAMVGFLGGAFSFFGGGSAALGEGTMTGFSEVIPNAKGGVYDSPSLSSFSNQVHDSPQMFAFAKGAGIFAEAGPEAIMPLARGPDGSLGVVAMNGGSDGGGSSISFGGITQHIQVGGQANAATLADVRRAAEQGARDGYELMLRDFKTNGAGRQMLQRR
ncbi:phage tail tape measure protein [Pseudomonas putida]|uniref:phage tail tape measure protein n=1 Tax=Pseudomonas putida TaxID=303 RepID=UPI000953920E|nr:phage tail tape measure protein [Pseudomonas putida]SIR95890.1 phage tail tape measure protein, lambda family [Pseudomonas putida]